MGALLILLLDYLTGAVQFSITCMFSFTTSPSLETLLLLSGLIFGVQGIYLLLLLSFYFYTFICFPFRSWCVDFLEFCL